MLCWLQSVTWYRKIRKKLFWQKVIADIILSKIFGINLFSRSLVLKYCEKTQLRYVSYVSPPITWKLRI